ncbi:hypothetical protein L0222_31595 [bacterium]|nr:hypothetical protein [bacterium]
MTEDAARAFPEGGVLRLAARAKGAIMRALWRTPFALVFAAKRKAGRAAYGSNLLRIKLSFFTRVVQNVAAVAGRVGSESSQCAKSSEPKDLRSGSTIHRLARRLLPFPG